MSDPRRLQGVGVSPGVGFAPAMVVHWGFPDVADRTVDESELEGEVLRLHARDALCANAVHARVEHDERRRSRKRGGETQRPRRSLSEAAVKKCGVAFPRPRVNGSAARI